MDYFKHEQRNLLNILCAKIIFLDALVIFSSTWSNKMIERLKICCHKFCKKGLVLLIVVVYAVTKVVFYKLSFKNFSFCRCSENKQKSKTVLLIFRFFLNYAVFHLLKSEGQAWPPFIFISSNFMYFVL